MTLHPGSHPSPPSRRRWVFLLVLALVVGAAWALAATIMPRTGLRILARGESNWDVAINEWLTQLDTYGGWLNRSGRWTATQTHDALEIAPPGGVGVPVAPIFDSAVVSSCTSRKAVSGSLSYCDGAGWIRSVTGAGVAIPICGDNDVNDDDEQCDGTDVGVCGTVAGCGSDCRCLFPYCGTAADCPGGATVFECTANACVPLCGNGTLDSGEACDPQLPEGLCAGRCTQSCTCGCVCGDQIREAGCTGSYDEGCELTAGGTAVSWGNAVDFKGTSRADRADTASLDFITGDFSVEAWVYISTAQTNPLIWKGGTTAANAGWGFHVLSNGQLRLSTTNGSAMASCTSTAGTIPFATWTHVAATRTGATCNLYYATAGSSVHTTETGTVQADTLANTQIFALGAQGTTYYLAGKLDDVRVWNDVRTQAELDANFQAPVACDAANLLAYWKLDEAGGSTSWTDCVGSLTVDYEAKAGCTASCNAIEASGVPTTATDPTYSACAAGYTCQTTGTAPCTCVEDYTSGARTVYATAAGATGPSSTAGLGTTGSPWTSLHYAFSPSNPDRVRPGDTLVLKNGTYGKSTTGLLRIVAGPSSSSTTSGACSQQSSLSYSAQCGTVSAPITVKGETAGSVILASDGSEPAIWMRGASYYTIQDLVATSQDAATVASPFCSTCPSTVLIETSTQSTFDNILVHGTNSRHNVHAFSVNNSAYITVDRTELYKFHRHGLSLFGSHDITARRVYANDRDSSTACTAAQCADGNSADCDSAACSPSPTVSQYGTSASIVENFIGESSGGSNSTKAIGISPTGGVDGTGNALNTQYVGVIGIGGTHVFSMAPRGYSITAGKSWPKNITVKDSIFLSPTSVDGYGMFVRGGMNSTFQDITITGGQAGGFRFDEDPSANVDGCGAACYITCTASNTAGYPCSFTLTDVLSFSNTNNEFSSDNTQASCVENYTDDAGGSRSGPTGCTGGAGIDAVNAAPTLMGLTGTGCITHVPAGSNFVAAGTGGTPLGADVRCRFLSGVKQTGASYNMFRVATGDTSADCNAAEWAASSGCKGEWLGGTTFIVAAYNGVDGDSRFDVHERLNIKGDASGCPFASSNLDCP